MRARRPTVRLLALVATTAALGVGAAVAALSVVPKGGRYAGNAGAGFPVSFKVSADGKQITELRTDFEGTVNCGPAVESPPYFDFPALGIVKGSFHGATTTRYGSGISPSYTIRGTFGNATHAGGTIHVYFTYPHNALPPCDETDAFSVTRVR